MKLQTEEQRTYICRCCSLEYNYTLLA